MKNKQIATEVLKEIDNLRKTHIKNATKLGLNKLGNETGLNFYDVDEKISYAKGLLTAWKNELEFLINYFAIDMDFLENEEELLRDEIQDLTESIKILEDGLK